MAVTKLFLHGLFCIHSVVTNNLYDTNNIIIQIITLLVGLNAAAIT